jgi:hypothetical protein
VAGFAEGHCARAGSAGRGPLRQASGGGEWERPKRFRDPTTPAELSTSFRCPSFRNTARVPGAADPTGPRRFLGSPLRAFPSSLTPSRSSRLVLKGDSERESCR